MSRYSPNQILGDFNGPLKSCGKVTAKAKTELKQKIMDFYNCSVTARRSHKKRFAQPAYPNLRAIVAWDQALQSATRGLGMAAFSSPEARAGSAERTSEVRFEVDWARRGPVIHDHLDFGSIDMPSKHFLYTDVQLHGWRWPDVIHTKNNNCKNAIIAANLGWARHERSLTLFQARALRRCCLFRHLVRSSGHVLRHLRLDG